MRRLFLALIATLLASCGAPAAAPAPTALAPSPTPPSGADLASGLQIDIGGRSLFIRCVGPQGSGPTVIFEAGLGGDHSSWDAAQRQLGDSIRSCSYDRAGTGASDPAPAPRGGAAVTADLQALLQVADVPGPYILVGHSFGALFVRLFAAAAPAQTLGVVLVDPVPEDWWARALATLPPPSDNDSERLRGFRQYLTDDVANPSKNPEGLSIPAIVSEVQAAGDLGGRPLVILSAGVFDVLAPGLPPNIEGQLQQLFQRELPQQLLALSTDSTQVAVPDSGHALPRQRPDMVVLAIQAVLSSATHPGGLRPPESSVVLAKLASFAGQFGQNNTGF